LTILTNSSGEPAGEGACTSCIWAEGRPAASQHARKLGVPTRPLPAPLLSLCMLLHVLSARPCSRLGSHGVVQKAAVRARAWPHLQKPPSATQHRAPACPRPAAVSGLLSPSEPQWRGQAGSTGSKALPRPPWAWWRVAGWNPATPKSTQVLSRCVRCERRCTIAGWSKAAHKRRRARWAEQLKKVGACRIPWTFQFPAPWRRRIAGYPARQRRRLISLPAAPGLDYRALHKHSSSQ
jgi:hypothetical protein